MAIKAKLAGCCDCGAGACSLECESQGGTATLCGISEISSPSTPPKKYRKQTLSGVKATCNPFGRADCNMSGGGAAGVDGITGDLTYSATDCSTVNNQYSTNPGLIVPCTIIAPTGVTTLIGPAISLACATGLDTTYTSGPTFEQCEGNNTCRPLGGGSTITKGFLRRDLSVEDTEDDAENRAKTGTWVAGSCSVAATRSTRGAGSFDFSFTAVRVRANCTGLVPFNNYTVEIQFSRRVAGSGAAYELFSSQYTSLSPSTADVPHPALCGTPGHDPCPTLAEMQTPWFDVPSEHGYETIASGCRVTLIL